MGNKEKITLKVLFLMIFLLSLSITIPFAVSAPSIQSADSQIACTESRITLNKSDQRYPAIFEDKIVWQDAREG